MRSVVIARNFPRPSIQTGFKIGSGRLGGMLWGGGRTLNWTLGCADLWDHRGGLEWSPKQNFKTIRALLEAHDAAGLKNLFASDTSSGVNRPSLLPAGRLRIVLPRNCRLERGELCVTNGVLRIIYTCGGKLEKMEFQADMSCRTGFVARGIPREAQLELISSWTLFRGVDYKKHQLCPHNSLAEHGFAPPQNSGLPDGEIFVQPLPADPAYAVRFIRRGTIVALDLKRGDFTSPAEAAKHFDGIPEYAPFTAAGRAWWRRYWRSVPQIKLGDAGLEQSYWQGLFEYGIMTNPAGVPPGLQGPWIEDDRLPPWSGDYHFNINVQMCLLPGLRGGHPEHLKPLFDLVWSRRDRLRRIAKCFAGIDDGYMLPHAVDDRGVCMGGFWTGAIDHACAAWIAQLMFEYCDYADDRKYLEEVAYPFMRGVMRVFEVLIERMPNGSLRLPVSISPEYRGSSLDACGVNSSFQLAAIHRLARNLLAAARELGTKPDEFWGEVEARLPACSFFGGESEREIALWENLALRESHRHHSHLGGLCPFDTIDPDAPEWRDTVLHSLKNWTRCGMGEWTGWCVPWASQLRTRMGQGEMACELLELWRRNFTLDGSGSFHDGLFPGLTIYSAFRGEVMQMDGAMGAVTAIQDMLLHRQCGVLKLFYGVSKRWRECSFSDMAGPGGVRVSASYSFGRTRSVEVRALRSGEVALMLADHPGKVFRRTLATGEVWHPLADVELKVK